MHKFNNISDFNKFRNDLITRRRELGGTKHNNVYRLDIDCFDSVFVSLMSFYHFEKQLDITKDFNPSTLVEDLTKMKNNWLNELTTNYTDTTSRSEIMYSITYIEYFIKNFLS